MNDAATTKLANSPEPATSEQVPQQVQADQTSLSVFRRSKAIRVRRVSAPPRGGSRFSEVKWQIEGGQAVYLHR